MSNGIPDELSPPRPPAALSPLGQMLDGLRPSRRMMSEDERHLVTDELFWESEELTAHLVRFFVLIVLSTLLAAFGLAANSEEPRVVLAGRVRRPRLRDTNDVG